MNETTTGATTAKTAKHMSDAFGLPKYEMPKMEVPAEFREMTDKGVAQFLPKADLRHLQELLGEGAFGLLKDYRDGVIHARHINVATGVGTKVDRRAAVFDYLIRKDGLDAGYGLLVAVTKELDEAVKLV